MAEQTKKTPLDIADDIEKNIFPLVMTEQPTTMLSFTGEIQDTRESGRDFINAIYLVCFLIFAILAILFNSISPRDHYHVSYPFWFGGDCFWPFGCMARSYLVFFAAIGALGLAGVVVNDSHHNAFKT